MTPEQKRKFQVFTRRYVDCQYALGDTGKGYDCLNAVMYLFRDLGYDFPTEYKGFTEGNYAAKWKAGEGRRELGEFFLTLGKSIEKNYLQAGDVIVFEGSKNTTFVGTYTGNDHILLVFNLKKRGGKIIPLSHFLGLFEAKIIGIRRLL